MDDELRRRIHAELARAERARDEGREGRARVCARRAAGWSLGGYYRERTGAPAPESAFELLRWYQDHAGVPSDLRAAARRLTSRVNEDFRLPHGEDPLEDARRLIEANSR
jgi:HEPN domain-containing protein